MRALLILLFIIPLTCVSQDQKGYADIISVKATESEDSYTFSVGISSPDKGCKQYANWWEVVSTDGDLIYRRILGHSHVNEQPFVRSGGRVKIDKDEIVIVRAHMNTSGYGGIMFKGSVEAGFKQIDADKEFALGLEKESPQPSGCAF